MQPKNTEFKALVEEKFRVNAFSHLMGVRLSSIEYRQVEATLNLTGDLLQQNNVAHGGVLMSLSDIVAGFAAFTVVEKTEHVVTAEIKVSCLRPATGQLLARGVVIKPGQNIIFCESEVWTTGDAAKLVAKSSSSMAVVRNWSK